MITTPLVVSLSNFTSEEMYRLIKLNTISRRLPGLAGRRSVEFGLVLPKRDGLNRQWKIQP